MKTPSEIYKYFSFVFVQVQKNYIQQALILSKVKEGSDVHLDPAL